MNAFTLKPSDVINKDLTTIAVIPSTPDMKPVNMVSTPEAGLKAAPSLKDVVLRRVSDPMSSDVFLAKVTTKSGNTQLGGSNHQSKRAGRPAVTKRFFEEPGVFSDKPRTRTWVHADNEIALLL